MPKQVLIYDPYYDGHHLLCIRHVASVFLENGYEIVYATHPDTVGSEQYRNFLEPIENRLKIVFIPIKKKPKTTVIRLITELVNVILTMKRNKVSRVFLPYCDHVFYTLGILGKVLAPAMRGRIDGIFFRGDYAYPSVTLTWTQRIKLSLALRGIRLGYFAHILFCDILAYEFHRNIEVHSSSHSPTKISFCPEYIEDSVHNVDLIAFKQECDIPASAKVLGSFGVLDERKGTDLLVRGFHAAATDRNCYLLLMGKLAPNIRKVILEINDPNIIVIDRFVSDDELFAGIRVSDVVAVTYPRHAGSSQILIRAAAQKKPILASDYGVVAFLTQKYQLGMTIKVTSPEEMEKGISWAFNEPRVNPNLCEELARKNTAVEFKKAIAYVL